MNHFGRCAVVFGFLGAWSALGGQVVPANPTGFKSRTLGPTSAEAGASVAPREEPKVRHVTYLVLSGIRQWTSTDGRQIIGKVIAFEDMVVETTAGEAAPAEPVLPSNPTVVRDGKVRLLINKKATTVSLDRLIGEDRAYVEEIRKQREGDTPAEQED